MIPAQAVEAAWDKLHENPRHPIAIQYSELQAALEDAAPHIRAQAWEEGYTLGYADCANKQESNRPNPYMLNNEGEK